MRPLTSQEIKQGGKQVLDIAPPCIGIGERRFTYDAVFDSYVGQQELYESISKPLLGSFVDGYNATVSTLFHFFLVCFMFTTMLYFLTNFTS